jgi:endoglucanase
VDPASYVYGEFRRFRFNNLNIHYHPGFMNWLASQPFGGGTLLEVLKRELGYRFHLRRVEVDRGTVGRGGTLRLTLYLANQVFGGMYNPKALSLVFLREGDGLRVERTLDETFHGPPPGEEEERVYTYRVQAPAQSGRYRLYLSIADPDFPNDPRYYVQLATRTTYREGLNDLVLAIRVQ